MKVLVVEDEAKTAAYLRTGLSENGFVVDVAEHGEDGLHFALSHDYDVVILDVMLPRRDGWSVLADLRAAGKQTPVLFLTARDAIPDRVRGFELGSDDYLVKPFAFAELLARIRSLARRGPGRVDQRTLRVHDLEIDFFRHQAVRSGQPINLTPKEFALLSLLATRRGEVLSRTVIAEQVWDMNFDPESNVVDVHVKRLRTKLDDPFDLKLVRTVRGVGYVVD
jgi:two-component system copper resistance phosphate regulon response regulator CusR